MLKSDHRQGVTSATRTRSLIGAAGEVNAVAQGELLGERIRRLDHLEFAAMNGQATRMMFKLIGSAGTLRFVLLPNAKVP